MHWRTDAGLKQVVWKIERRKMLKRKSYGIKNGISKNVCNRLKCQLQDPPSQTIMVYNIENKQNKIIPIRMNWIFFINQKWTKFGFVYTYFEAPIQNKIVKVLAFLHHNFRHHFFLVPTVLASPENQIRLLSPKPGHLEKHYHEKP